MLPQNLIYYPDSQPGIARRRCGRGFSYVAADGTSIDDPRERQRLARLAVPPAYNNVWMCPLPNGHLQATGVDNRSRKQYRYHPGWSEARAVEKYSNLAAFGEALPAIRRRILRDLAKEAGDLSFALAAAVFLIDRLSLRVGNRDYAIQNNSYGALTLKRNHVKIVKGLVHLNFTAKGGKRVRHRVGDRKLQRVLQKARDLPGADLLVWFDEAGDRHVIGSSTLNAYLSEVSGRDVTAKTFRTWAGSVAALEAAMRAEEVSVKVLANAAAERLFNTPTVAKSSYIHPAVLALAGQRYVSPEVSPIKGLSRAEATLLTLLQEQSDIAVSK